MQQQAESVAADGQDNAAKIQAEADAREKEAEVQKKQETQETPPEEQPLN